MTDLDRRHLGRFVAFGGAALALAGCTTQAATIATGTKVVGQVNATVASTAAEATTWWGIIKGVAIAASAGLVAGGPTAAAVSAGIATVDAVVANLPAIEADVSAMATAIATIYQQGNAVLLAAAPLIKVIPNGAKA